MSVLRFIVLMLKGAAMGTANVIPGVSGGTLALILGIYQRFIGAVSAIGPGMALAILTRDFWSRVMVGLRDPDAVGDDEIGAYAGNVLFLASLGAGIGTAILIGARFIPDLLAVYPAQMKGFFFGLVLASVSIPFSHMKQRSLVHGVVLIAAIVGTYTLMGLPVSTDGRATGEVELTVAEVFARLDTDGSGTLDMEEVERLAAALGGMAAVRQVHAQPPQLATETDVVLATTAE